MRLLTLLLLFLSSTVIAGGPLLENKARTIAPEIDKIILCGNWEYSKNSGYIRVIAGWNGTYTEIYIQWISVDKNGKRKIVNSTVFDKFGTRDFEQVQCDSGTGLPTITLLTEEIEFIGAQIVKIRPENVPGKYKFSDYRNK